MNNSKNTQLTGSVTKNGENISIQEAREYIDNYVREDCTGKPKDQIVVGHKFDLTLIKAFMNEIDRLIREGNPIDSIRIYHAKSTRPSTMKYDLDLVIVPTHENDVDHHIVYEPMTASSPEPAILGHSTPCPNVCQKTLRPCPE